MADGETIATHVQVNSIFLDSNVTRHVMRDGILAIGFRSENKIAQKMPEPMDPGSSRQIFRTKQKKKSKKPVVKSAKLRRLAEKQKVENVDKLAMEYVSMLLLNLRL